MRNRYLFFGTILTVLAWSWTGVLAQDTPEPEESSQSVEEQEEAQPEGDASEADVDEVAQVEEDETSDGEESAAEEAEAGAEPESVEEPETQEIAGQDKSFDEDEEYVAEASEDAPPTRAQAEDMAAQLTARTAYASWPRPSREKESPLGLQYRGWGEFLDIPSFDPEGGSEAESTFYQRLRVDFGTTYGSISLRVEADLFQGELYGAGPAEIPEMAITGTRPRGGAFSEELNYIDPRNAYLVYRGIAEIRLGLQTSHFGQGLLANDGREEPLQLFNQKYGADRGLRALIATRPFELFAQRRSVRRIHVALGGDLVYRDDNASFVEGDRAYQFIASVFHQDQDAMAPENQRFTGVYFARRSQTDRDGAELNVMAFDASKRNSWTSANNRWWFQLGGEAALLAGSTSRSWTQQDASDTSILALGAVGEFQAWWKSMGIGLKLDAGYASGDADSDDDTLYRFRFDPNYKVGLILFDHYIPAVTRESYDRVNDPTRTAQPPRGVSGLINDGAVENAVYINPQILFGDPEGLLTGIGVLWAQSAVPFADPYNSFAGGGTPVGVLGARPASRDLGIELDVAARYKRHLAYDLHLEVKAEYGLFLPGRAFDDEFGNAAAPVNLVRGRLGLIW